MIYVFLAQGFEEIEALTTVDILRRADIKVTTVGVGNKKIIGAHGISVIADVTENEVVIDNIKAVILPGGMPGTINLENNDTVKNSVKYCNDNNLLICAICAAPSILGHMGLLREVKATCFPGFENELTNAFVTNDFVVKDKNIITAKGAGSTIPFALAIVEQLVDAKLHKRLRWQFNAHN